MYTMSVTILCLTLVSAEVTTLSSDQTDQPMNETVEYDSTTMNSTAKEPVASMASDNATDIPVKPCIVQNLDLNEVQFIEKDYMIVNKLFKTIHVLESEVSLSNGDRVCFNRSDTLKAMIMAICKKFQFDKDEYELFENGSVGCYGDVYEPGMFEIVGDGILKVCAEPEVGVLPPPQRPHSDGIGKIGCIISIIALVIHLSVFCMVPALRNVPGCTLAALSVSFLMGCTFYLVGQIEGVKGHFCTASAILQLYFLLASFFCLNTMAVDVWRTFRLSTRNLVVYSDDNKRKRLAYYMAYAWGAPLLFTSFAIVADHASWTPKSIKPWFGARGICWIYSPWAHVVFFAAPAFAIIVANGALFVASAVIIRSNAFKDAKMDLMLFVRLACMMGVAWLVSVVAVATGDAVLWRMSDVLNSLQGLFLLVLFTCSKRVVRRVREKFGWMEPSSSGNHTTTKRSCVSEAL